MSLETPCVASENYEFADSGTGRSRRRRRLRWGIVTVLLMLLLGGVVVGLRDAFGSTKGASGSSDNGSATTLVTVTRRSLSAQMQVTGTLGYAGNYSVLGRQTGTVTWLPEPGQVVGEGQVLYRVDDVPVVLLYGSTPAYRTLAEDTTVPHLAGKDVAQLNHDLVALGYVDRADVESKWDTFNWATKAGVAKLQRHLGVAQTGTFALGRVVFVPTAARITALQANVGGPATGTVMHASSTTRTINVALNADLQSEVKSGDQVTVTLPNGGTTPGRIAVVGKVATIPSNNAGGNDSSPTVPVTIRPTDPAATGNLDQAPVLVTITTNTVRDALTVPVNALLALAGGGYAVEVTNANGTRRRVSVSPGLFDEATGLVQVTGSGLAAGQSVVAPAS